MRKTLQFAKSLYLNWLFRRHRSRESIDRRPWEHPFLTNENLLRFRKYSEDVWRYAEEYAGNHTRPLKMGFSGNMAQNMFKFCRLVCKYGGSADLILDPQDKSAISQPEWEIFDGEFNDVLDGQRFLRQNPQIEPDVLVHRLPLDGTRLTSAIKQVRKGDRRPLLRLLSETPDLCFEAFSQHPNFLSFFEWARLLANYDVIYAAVAPFAAYASGKPYCTIPVGGPLEISCGESGDYGFTMAMAFNRARFMMISNPHILGHSRRLGFTNGVYLPYPMDDDRYCPGKGKSRLEWSSTYGEGVYVLVASRLDKAVKGFDDSFFKVLLDVARRRPQLRIIVLAWGNDWLENKARLEESGLKKQFIALKTVGKKRLLDYYRSVDIVIDTFVYGYYGATGLEAASVGKPVIMKIRSDHYHPLYAGDVVPVMNAADPQAMGRALTALVDNPQLRLDQGRKMREWLVRNHGEKRTVPLLMALLRLAADRVPLPQDLISPLMDKETDAETAYHVSRQVR